MRKTLFTTINHKQTIVAINPQCLWSLLGFILPFPSLELLPNSSQLVEYATSVLQAVAKVLLPGEGPMGYAHEFVVYA